MPAGPVQETLAPTPPRESGGDRFDDAIVVTRTRAWIGLASCLVLILGVIVWAVTTEVGVTVKGPAVELVNGAIATVPSPASGTVQVMNVKVDDEVQASQVIGTVADSQNQVSSLVAPVGGRILNVAADVGATVRTGADVVSIAQTNGPLLIRMFVTPAQAQEADLHTEAILNFPEQPEIRGRVSDIGTLPLTDDQVADSIGSPALANLLVRSGAVVNITVTPADPASGPKHADIDSGDIGTVTLIVGTKRPIDYVV